MDSTQPTSFESIGGAPLSIFLLHPDLERAETLRGFLAQRGLTVTMFGNSWVALVSIYADPPDIVVIHWRVGPDGGQNIAETLKADNAFVHLPILFLMPPECLEELAQLDHFPYDDYLLEDAALPGLLLRIALCIERTRRQLDANPLTHLPGNARIMRELETRIARGALFSAVYLDLDNFKAFNDRYGFTRGDEALRLTARLTAISVRQGAPHDSFVGHVGGDDFLFLLPIDTAETVCQQLIELFDQMIRSLYDDEERRQGCIRSVNRKGEQETFPLMSISLAVVPNYGARFTHPGQISSVAAELKKLAKKRDGSNYVVDRRIGNGNGNGHEDRNGNGKGKGHKQDPDEK